MQEAQQSQECDIWFSFPDLDMGSCEVTILSCFTAQKDATGVHHSLLFLIFPVMCHQTLAPPHAALPFPSFCVIPLLFFCLSLGNSHELCVFPDGFFANMIPEAHEWTPAKIVLMNIDSRREQEGYEGNLKISVFPSGPHSSNGRQQMVGFSSSIKS